jgi:hypothetical protein
MGEMGKCLLKKGRNNQENAWVCKRKEFWGKKDGFQCFRCFGKIDINRFSFSIALSLGGCSSYFLLSDFYFEIGRRGFPPGQKNTTEGNETYPKLWYISAVSLRKPKDALKLF